MTQTTICCESVVHKSTQNPTQVAATAVRPLEKVTQFLQSEPVQELLSESLPSVPQKTELLLDRCLDFFVE